MTGRPKRHRLVPFTMRSERGQGGYALFFVLSLILLLSLLLTGVTRDSRQQARAALRGLETAQARADAETALSLTVMRLLAAKPENRWNADGKARLVKIGEAEWRVTVTPEDGKVDINHAQAALLTELFTAAGATPDEAASFADRIADWRDADDLTRLNGAERRYYESAGLPPPRNGPFLKPGEIRRVMGMTEELYACIAGAITVYSGKAGLDRRFAPPLLRKASASVQTAATGARSPAASPLASESLAGRAITVRLAPQDHKRGASEFILRLTENPASPWWLLGSKSRARKPAPNCVPRPPQNHPEGEISTFKG